MTLPCSVTISTGTRPAPSSTRRRTDCVAASVAGYDANHIRDQELLIEALVERIEPRGEVHGVADHGVFLAPRRTDIARDHFAEVNADADAQRPACRLVDPRIGFQHF